MQAFKDPVEDKLIDFEYSKNDNGTYTITGWKGTYGGKASTELILLVKARLKKIREEEIDNY
jgi:hypothetical protein